jgi:hypothetical protein
MPDNTQQDGQVQTSSNAKAMEEGDSRGTTFTLPSTHAPVRGLFLRRRVHFGEPQVSST